MVNEQLSGMLSGLRSSTDSSLAAFAAMEEKVMVLEAEAEGAAMVRSAIQYSYCAGVQPTYITYNYYMYSTSYILHPTVM